jgi:hypothetical protein
LKRQNFTSIGAALFSDREHCHHQTKEDRNNTTIKKVRHSIFNWPALSIFLILICCIIVGEAGADSQMWVLHPYSKFVTTIIDSALLIASVFAFLYFFILRPFRDYRTQYRIGLLLCKEFVEKQGGRLWVESEENIGSSFYLTLPADKIRKIKR